MRPTTLALFASAGLIAVPALAQTAPGRTPMAAPATQAAPATAAPVDPAAPATPGQPAPAAQAPAATPTTTIAAALPAIPDRATLLRLVTAAKLTPTLSGPGPFTLFAPEDAAFARLPAGTLDTLLAPANVASLTTILKNHIVAGSLTSDQIRERITAGGGRATLTTLSGQPLVASIENESILLTDAVGNKSYVDQGDLPQTNGIIHGTNGISLPKLG